MKLIILLTILGAVSYAVFKMREKLAFLNTSPATPVKVKNPTQKSLASKSQSLSTDQLFTNLIKDEQLVFKDEQKNGYVIVIEEGNPRGKRITLIGTTIVLGRSPANDVTIDDPMISDRHCRIELTEAGGMHLEDLDSTNGTILNGKRIKKADIKSNDLIHMGKTKLRLIKDD